LPRTDRTRRARAGTSRAPSAFALCGFGPRVSSLSGPLTLPKPITLRGRGALDVAAHFKAAGNALYKAGKLEAALAEYALALAAVPQAPSADAAGEAGETRLACLCNMAACALGQGDFPAAVAHCDAVLAESPEHPKALFRRGTAPPRHADRAAAPARAAGALGRTAASRSRASAHTKPSVTKPVSQKCRV